MFTFYFKKNNQINYLHLVDLAGSEKIYKYETNLETIKESKNINLSLLNLQKVILALEKKSNGYLNKHIPYRNSSLTLFLKDCFEKNSIIRIILTLNIEKEHYHESISSIRFGLRCKNIKIQYLENKKKSGSIKRQQNENLLIQKIELLEKQLDVFKNLYEESLKQLDEYKKPKGPFKLSDRNFEENYVNDIVTRVKKYLHNEEQEIEIKNIEDALVVCETIKMLYKEDNQKIKDTILQINDKMKNYEKLHNELKIINEEYVNIENNQDSSDDNFDDDNFNDIYLEEEDDDFKNHYTKSADKKIKHLDINHSLNNNNNKNIYQDPQSFNYKKDLKEQNLKKDISPDWKEFHKDQDFKTKILNKKNDSKFENLRKIFN